MASSDSDLFRRQGYHHGNLREALIAAARDLIAERGPAGFTLIEAARRAGVSAAAPYRHFKDRDALVAEVRRRGFQEFGRRLAAAWGDAETDPMRGLSGMGTAYLAFAREHPGYYSAMFAPGPARKPGQLADTDDTFTALEVAIGRVARDDQHGTDISRLAYEVWALTHGVATLASAGFLGADGAPHADEILSAGVEKLLAGAAAQTGPAGTRGESRSRSASEPPVAKRRVARRRRSALAKPPRAAK